MAGDIPHRRAAPLVTLLDDPIGDAAVEAFFADRDLAPATRRAYRATYGSLPKAFGAEMAVTALPQWLTVSHLELESFQPFH